MYGCHKFSNISQYGSPQLVEFKHAEFKRGRLADFREDRSLGPYDSFGRPRLFEGFTTDSAGHMNEK